MVTLATAKRVGELQALSRVVSSQGDDFILLYLPHFIAKTERDDAPLPRSFRLCSLAEFAGDLEDGFLFCPVCALHTYLELTKSFSVGVPYAEQNRLHGQQREFRIRNNAQKTKENDVKITLSSLAYITPIRLPSCMSTGER